jgi:hypothetical protein
MICFGAAGFLMNSIFSFAEVRIIPWRRKELENAR